MYLYLVTASKTTHLHRKTKKIENTALNEH